MHAETSTAEASNASTEAPDWAQLIQAARSGCDVALGAIITELQGYLLSVANQNLGTGLQAKFGASDVVQQSLMEAGKSIETFEGNSEAELRSWLKRIVMHNLIDASRRYTGTQARNADREIPADGFDGWDEVNCGRTSTASWLVSRKETDLELMDAVRALPPRQRTVVEKRHRWGQSYQQIADTLSISEPAARNLWSRAMQNLRDKLVNDDGQTRKRQPR